MGNVNWGGAIAQGFAQAFAQTMEKSYERKKMRMRLDAEMGIRGYERMDDSDVKDYVRSQKALAFEAEGGGATIPQGAKAKNGVISDKSGNTIGEYAPGYGPKQMKKIEPSTGEVVNFGGNYYKFNADLAKKMSGKEEPTANVIKNVTDKLNEEFKERGSWNPSMAYIDGNAYRFSPTEQTVSPQAQELNLANESKLKMRSAIQNALASGASLDEVIAGIKEEGYDPKDFADLLKTQQQVQQTPIHSLESIFGLPMQPAKPAMSKTERQNLRTA